MASTPSVIREGTTVLARGRGANPAALEDEVTRPAGCTIAGLLTLEDGRIRFDARPRDSRRRESPAISAHSNSVADGRVASPSGRRRARPVSVEIARGRGLSRLSAKSPIHPAQRVIRATSLFLSEAMRQRPGIREILPTTDCVVRRSRTPPPPPPLHFDARVLLPHVPVPAGSLVRPGEPERSRRSESRRRPISARGDGRATPGGADQSLLALVAGTGGRPGGGWGFSAAPHQRFRWARNGSPRQGHAARDEAQVDPRHARRPGDAHRVMSAHVRSYRVPRAWPR